MKNISKNICKNKGISTLEALIALSVFALVISSITVLFFETHYLVMNAPHEIVATYASNFNLERAMRIGESRYDNASSSTSTEGAYTSILNVTPIDNNTKKIESIVRFGTLPNDYVEETGYLSDFNDAYG